MCLMMLQDHGYEAHISNTGKDSGKGMNLKQKLQGGIKLKKILLIDAMQNGDIKQEAMFDFWSFKKRESPTYF